MKTAEHPALEALDLITVLAALADPIRLDLVRQLSEHREVSWGDLVAPVAKSTLSHHMRVLRDAGLTRTRQEGTRCFVKLRTDDLAARFPGLLDLVRDEPAAQPSG